MVDSAPLVRLDGTEGGLAPFHSVVSMMFDSDSTILLGEMALVRLRQFSIDGDFIQTVGASGQGPGEFGAMNRFQRQGDSILIYDSRWNRVSIFDGTYNFVRLFVLPPSPWSVQPRFAGRLSDGRTLVSGSRPQTGVSWAFHDMDGTPLEPAPDIPVVPPIPRSAPTASGGYAQYSPFRFRTHAIVEGDRIYTIRGHQWQVDVRRSDGSLEELWRLDHPATAFAEKDQEAWRDRMAERERQRNAPSEFLDYLEKLEIPDSLPTLGRTEVSGPPPLIVDDRGRLWTLQQGHPDVEHWLVWDEGELVGILTLPERRELHGVQGDLLAVVARDDFDVETVELYRFRSPGREQRSEGPDR